jgi:hypothetical protein
MASATSSISCLALLWTRGGGSHVFKLMFIWALVKNKGYGSEIYKEYEKKVEHFMERVECSAEIRAVLVGEVGKLDFVSLSCN